MDKIDCKLIELLQADARTSITELSAQVHLNRTSVKNRIDKLLDEGVIESFTTNVSLKAMGKILLFVQLSNLKKSPDEILEILANNEEVIEIHILTGSTDILFKYATRDLESAFMFLKGLTHFTSVLTSTILYTHLNNRPIRPFVE